MKKYEAMFMLKPDLNETQAQAIFKQINELILKNAGQILSSGLWSERRKLFFPVKKYKEAIYYLVEFSIAPEAVSKLKAQYRLNEEILRFMVTRID